MPEFSKKMEIVSTQIQEYAEQFTSPENEVLRELREKTFAERGDKQMLSGFYQGRLLAMFSQMMRPRRILEIGTFMGYSALCLAEGLPVEGKIITLDVNPETNKIARGFWEKSELNSKIVLFVGNALEIIPTLDETFDFVFIDADKPNYANYYDLVFSKVRIGGILLADNVLAGGRVLNPDGHENAAALHRFNQKVQADARVSSVLLAVRDGLMLIRKERN